MPRTVQPLDFGKRSIAGSFKKSRTGVKQRDGLPEGDGDRYTLSYIDQFANRTAVGRWGQPRELAGPALLLASDAGSYITGHNLVVDGGWTAW